MTNNDRDNVFDELRTMWTAADPVPEQLSARMIAAVESVNIDDEFALMTLVAQHDQLTGTRQSSTTSTSHSAAASTALSIEFAYNNVSVLVRIGPPDIEGMRRIDGWIAPQEGTQVRLTHPDGSLICDLDDGRFAFDEVPDGLVRLWFTGPDGDSLQLATPNFEI